MRSDYAYKKNEELIIALKGSFDVVQNDGKTGKRFHLNRSYYGLYVPEDIWLEMENFSTNSFALEFGSMPYDDGEYIRDFEEFLELVTVQLGQFDDYPMFGNFTRH